MEQVAPPPDVTILPLPTPFAIGRVNAYLLEGDPLTLVDPGPDMADARSALEEGLAAVGRRVEDVELVLLTHQHHDHVGLAAEVAERAGARVAGVAPLARFLADFDASMDDDDAFAVETMLRNGVEPEVVRSLDELSRAFRRFGGGARVELVLEEGERVRLGSRELTVHARPGHSPTDTVLHDASDGLLIGGDHLLEHVSSNPVAHVPIGVPDARAAARMPESPGPLRRYLESMRATAAMPVSTVLPGHGSPFRGHAELVARRETLHRRRAARILREVDGETTAARIASRLWRRVPVAQAYLALSEVLGHLDLLVADGSVVLDGSGDVVLPRRADGATAGLAAEA